MSEAKASGLGAAWRIMHALVLSVAAIALGLMLLAAPVRARAATDANAVNRFNVVLVVDASGSMALTDPEGYRFEAVSQFSGLLAEQGNYIGSVVFTEEIPAKVDVAPANSQADKDAILSSIASVPAGGDTNIGAALQTAVNMIKSGGNPDLPSVIVFLSDGNTDLATSEAMDESLEMKGEALQAAREGGIAVYSVCLNVDGGADISEMQQISNATGGQFAEVKTAADLQDVFNTFYALIYGTSTIQLVDEVFPSDGVLETPFDVPAGGVEEVNIVIYGSVTSTELVAPNGTSGTPDMLSGNTFSIIKLTDILPGTWTLKTTGAPGDRIRINMVYNSSLGVQASLDPESGMVNPADPMRIVAVLTEGGKPFEDASQYAGYEASVVFIDASGAEVASYPMSLEEAGFVAEGIYPEGVYQCYVDVSGNSLECQSDVLGPIIVSNDIDSEEFKNNQAPVPVKERVEETVLLWPFKENTYSIDMATLATDDQEEPLVYRIDSTSFMDDDYSVDGTNLTVSNFSIRTGAFTIVATDKWGSSCEIELVIKSHNVGLIALIGLGVLAVGALVALGILGYILSHKPFYGDVTVQAIVEGRLSGKMVPKKRGRIPLSVFNLDYVGIDYTKSYVQATGDTYVVLHTNTPVPYGGAMMKDIRIEDGINGERIIFPDNKQLIVQFTSRKRRR